MLEKHTIINFHIICYCCILPVLNKKLKPNIKWKPKLLHVFFYHFNFCFNKKYTFFYISDCRAKFKDLFRFFNVYCSINRNLISEKKQHQYFSKKLPCVTEFKQCILKATFYRITLSFLPNNLLVKIQVTNSWNLICWLRV